MRFHMLIKTTELLNINKIKYNKDRRQSLRVQEDKDTVKIQLNSLLMILFNKVPSKEPSQSTGAKSDL